MNQRIKGVLSEWGTAWGWKLLAFLEMALVLLFVRWFVRQGADFARRTQWIPSLNVAQMKLFQSIDTDGDGKLSMEEMRAGRSVRPPRS